MDELPSFEVARDSPARSVRFAGSDTRPMPESAEELCARALEAAGRGAHL